MNGSKGNSASAIGRSVGPRTDIQLLRAVAVVAVILNHLIGWPEGGFIGVDVFFVISGYLITSQLYREHEMLGKVSLRGFYIRRIRRILPVSTFVLAVTVAAGFAIYLSSRANSIAIDAAWALLFSANWHSAISGTNYWANNDLTSPLQHYWSLSVEEQFYFVWPAILLTVLGLSTSDRSGAPSRRRVLIVVLSLIIAGSLAWSLWESATHPTWAYFSTVSRAWELAVGGLLAVVGRLVAKVPQLAKSTLGWVGLAGIGASLFLVGESGFPAPWALLPVLSTVLVIAAGIENSRRPLFPLANPVTAYIGDISYSLYLWHFPVIVLIGALVAPGRKYIGVAVALTLLLSISSYHLLENPVRQSSWLLKTTRRAPGPSRKSVAVGVLSLVGVGVLLVGVSVQPSPTEVVPVVQPLTARESQARSEYVNEVPSESSESSLHLLDEIRSALSATAFPVLSPSIDELGFEAWVKQALVDGCTDVDVANVDDCASGPIDAVGDVVVIGDSFGMSWMPAIRAAFEPAGWRVHPLTKGQCPSASVDVVQNAGDPFPECLSHREWAFTQAAAIKPKLIILADAFSTISRLSSERVGEAGAEEFAHGLSTTIARALDTGADVVVLSSPPEAPALQQCVTRTAVPSDCVGTIVGDWWVFSRAQAAATRIAGAEFVDTRLWFCDIDDRCPGFVGSTPVRTDGGHMTAEYSSQLAGSLQAVLGLSPPLG